MMLRALLLLLLLPWAALAAVSERPATAMDGVSAVETRKAQTFARAPGSTTILIPVQSGYTVPANGTSGAGGTDGRASTTAELVRFLVDVCSYQLPDTSGCRIAGADQPSHYATGPPAR